MLCLSWVLLAPPIQVSACPGFVLVRFAFLPFCALFSICAHPINACSLGTVTYCFCACLGLVLARQPRFLHVLGVCSFGSSSFPFCNLSWICDHPISVVFFASVVCLCSHHQSKLPEKRSPRGEEVPTAHPSQKPRRTSSRNEITASGRDDATRPEEKTQPTPQSEKRVRAGRRMTLSE